MRIGATIEAELGGLDARRPDRSRTSAKATDIGAWRRGAWSRRVDPDRGWGWGRAAAWGGAAPEGLDDDHAAAAAGTGLRKRLGLAAVGRGMVVALARARRHGEEFTGAGDVVAAGAAGEQAVMANAVEAVGQHMDEEAADELAGRERHDLVARRPIGAIILVLEGDAVAVAGDQPAVGDGDAVGIAGADGDAAGTMGIWPQRLKRWGVAEAMNGKGG
jgi:hypothetical protein